MTTEIRPVARTQMMIRRPPGEVYRAFVDPEITRKFWFTKGSGRLETGASVTWEWSMYGVRIPVTVSAMEENARIAVEWGDPPSPVEWTFEERTEGTLVVIMASGFAGTTDERLAAALDSMGGFSFLLAGLKAFLEHGVELDLSLDHNPDARVT